MFIKGGLYFDIFLVFGLVSLGSFGFRKLCEVMRAVDGRKLGLIYIISAKCLQFKDKLRSVDL